MLCPMSSCRLGSRGSSGWTKSPLCLVRFATHTHASTSPMGIPNDEKYGWYALAAFAAVGLILCCLRKDRQCVCCSWLCCCCSAASTRHSRVQQARHTRQTVSIPLRSMSSSPAPSYHSTDPRIQSRVPSNVRAPAQARAHHTASPAVRVHNLNAIPNQPYNQPPSDDPIPHHRPVPHTTDAGGHGHTPSHSGPHDNGSRQFSTTCSVSTLPLHR